MADTHWEDGGSVVYHCQSGFDVNLTQVDGGRFFILVLTKHVSSCRRRHVCTFHVQVLPCMYNKRMKCSFNHFLRRPAHFRNLSRRSCSPSWCYVAP